MAEQNLTDAFVWEGHANRRYPYFVQRVDAEGFRVARREGFDEKADWFETLAKAGKSHAARFQKALEAL